MKNILNMDLFITNTTCGLLTLLVDFCDVFISCLNTPSDGTHSLKKIVSKWCNAKFIQICWDEETNLDGLKVSFQQLFTFGWTIPLNTSYKIWLINMHCAIKTVLSHRPVFFFSFFSTPRNHETGNVKSVQWTFTDLQLLSKMLKT